MKEEKFQLHSPYTEVNVPSKGHQKIGIEENEV